EILALFQEIKELLALEDGGRASFRVRAFERASEVIQASSHDLEALTLSKLTDIDGIGKSTAQCIRESYSTGRIARLEELRSRYPADFVLLTRIPGMGAKTALRLREELDIHNLTDLRNAIANHQLRKLPGLGGGMEERLSRALERVGSKENRRPIEKVLFVAELMVTELEELAEVERAQYGGSLRRFQETIADIDIVVVSEDPDVVMEYFLNMPRVAEILRKGETMAS